jgi:uncharacterized protein YnzC (UPF0291/DUF896 family)
VDRMQAFRDVYQILQFLTKEKGLDGDTQAALTRLREAAKTKGEDAAETRAQLETRRAYLKPRRIGLADKAQRLRAIVPQFGPKATPTQMQKARQAQILADKAEAELQACIVALADTEAALAAQH